MNLPQPRLLLKRQPPLPNSPRPRARRLLQHVMPSSRPARFRLLKISVGTSRTLSPKLTTQMRVRRKAPSAKPKRTNLFRRMTGLVSGRENQETADTAAPRREEPGFAAMPLQEEPTSQTSAEEEMLEIPAFLRRQAN